MTYYLLCVHINTKYRMPIRLCLSQLLSSVDSNEQGPSPSAAPPSLSGKVYSPRRKL